MKDLIMDQFKGADKWLNPTNVILGIAFYLAGSTLNTKLNRLDQVYDWMQQTRLRDSIEKQILLEKIATLQATNGLQNGILESHRESIDILWHYSPIPEDQKIKFFENKQEARIDPQYERF
jgi:hypothetical protein